MPVYHIIRINLSIPFPVRMSDASRGPGKKQKIYLAVCFGGFTDAERIFINRTSRIKTNHVVRGDIYCRLFCEIEDKFHFMKKREFICVET